MSTETVCRQVGAWMMPIKPCNQHAHVEDAELSSASGSFGELLFLARRSRQLSLRQLAEKANVVASIVSEYENARRPAPSETVVIRLANALNLPHDEANRLATLANQERTAIGLRVARTTPSHVAELLRDIAGMAQRLSPAQVRSIRQTLHLEAAMK